jgi:hypothetical protein
VKRVLLALVLLAPLVATVPAAGNVDVQKAPDRAYTLVMSGTGFNGFSYPDTPLLEAYLGQTVLFTIVVPPTAEPHTFHLHGHPWLVPDAGIVTPLDAADPPGTIVDTFLLMPGDAHSFEVAAGGIDQQAGDWMYHCHFEDHLAAGMWGIFRVYPYAMSVTGAGPSFDVALTHLGVPVDGAALSATLDGQPLPAHVQPLGDGRYQLHTALAPATKGVLVVTAHGALGESVARVGLGGASVPTPSLRAADAEAGLPVLAAHVH